MTQTLTNAVEVARGVTADTLRVVAYLRVSTKEQKQGYGVASQERKIHNWITRNGHMLVGTYPDEGVSGSLEVEDRPEGKRLMEDARAKKFDVVAVKAGDRIGRTGSLLEVGMGSRRDRYLRGPGQCRPRQHNPPGPPGDAAPAGLCRDRVRDHPGTDPGRHQPEGGSRRLPRRCGAVRLPDPGQGQEGCVEARPGHLSRPCHVRT